MTTTLRNLTNLKADRAITVLNQMRRDIVRMRAGVLFHVDASTAISTATAADLPTVIALANAIKASYNAHVASAVSATTGQGAHIAADATNPTAVADATDQTTANALLTDLKAKYNAHRVLTASHPVADATNTITSADATDLASSITLANELKTDINAHYAAALAADATNLVSP